MEKQVEQYPFEEPVNVESNRAVLHLLCGRIAAGKSTLARSLARRHKAVLLSEDDCLSQLFGDQIKTFDDYLHYSRQLKVFLHPHCLQLLKLGVNVVLDFPANTVKSRQWLLGLVEEAEARHVLHYLTTSKSTCWEQLQKRISEQEHNSKPASGSPIAVEYFDKINNYFVPPSVSEGFNVEINR